MAEDAEEAVAGDLEVDVVDEYFCEGFQVLVACRVRGLLFLHWVAQGRQFVLRRCYYHLALGFFLARGLVGALVLEFAGLRWISFLKRVALRWRM